jgi:signal transduction histidine kinase/ligand-binding sensor domain-containing protein
MRPARGRSAIRSFPHFEQLLLLLAASCSLLQVSASQTPGISGTNIVITRFSTPEGLSSNQVHAIVQDQTGFMWIGTDAGLNRFDGTSFKVFKHTDDSTSLSDNYVGTLLVDRQGALWVGTGKGLDRYDAENESFFRCAPQSTDGGEISGSGVNVIFEDRAGTVWVGTGAALHRRERGGTTWTRFVPSPGKPDRPGDNIISAILEDRYGTLWVGTGGFLKRGGGLLRFDRARGSFDRPVSVPAGGHPTDWVTALYEDRRGDLWVCFDYDDPRILDRRSGRLVPVRLPGVGPASPGRMSLKAVCEDGHGALWIATWGGGLFRYDRIQKSFSHYSCVPSNPASVSDNIINTLFADRSGLLWAGTERGGVNILATKPFYHRHALGDSLSLAGRVGALCADRQHGLWICSVGLGLLRYDLRGRHARMFLVNGITNAIFQDPSGRIWFDGGTNVNVYDPSTGSTRIVLTMPSIHGSIDGILRMFLQRDGSLWIGGYMALYHFDRSLSRYVVYRHDPANPRSITGGWINAITEDRHGAVWVSTTDGVSRYDSRTDTFTQFVHRPNDPSSLGSGSVNMLMRSHDGRLWVGTDGGLQRFEEENERFTSFPSPGERGGRPAGQILEDRKGVLWLVTTQGLSAFDPTTERYVHFDRSDGVEPGVDRRWSSTVLPSGELVIGTEIGILVFHPDSVRSDPGPPPVVITKVSTSTREITAAAAGTSRRQVIVGSREGAVTIDFAALCYDMSEFNQYAYLLEGCDGAWIDSHTRHQATYTNLEPGTYAFRVRGATHDGVWNMAGASLTLVIEPTFWQRGWVKTFEWVSLTGVVVLLFRREMKRLRREKRVQQEFSQQLMLVQERGLKHLAGELHDGLGQDLLVVNNELQQYLRDKEAPAEEVVRAAEMMKNSIQTVRELASNLHPHQLERLGLYAALESMAGIVSRSAGLRISLSGGAADGILTKEAEIHVYRIVQEALSNIVRHAGATAVTIEVNEMRPMLRIIVRDNGKGFANVPEAPRGPSREGVSPVSGFGFLSMHERARMFGGTLEIDSSPGSGTKIVLTVPRR